ncbi:ATP-binding protein [Enterovirga sp.]|uniref:hybrid sensor histidine kinase/response regulator n=1 Tax=Enterovirga sp. TaxID=2026350 RepID=UPI002CED337D|nr:ATP-binding protein [Enterovirga sp.]HMO29727.1 ATP-binding protein [Enterovirga sp.]
MTRADADPSDSPPVRDLLRAPDAGAFPLGPRSTWPAALRGALDLVLAAPMPIVLFAGPDFVALYNDAFAPTIGREHPAAFGRPAAGHWAGLWEDLRPLLRAVRETGQAAVARDRPLRVGGYPETACFDIACSAVPEEDGRICAVLCMIEETTGRALADRRLRESEARFTEHTRERDRIWQVSRDLLGVATLEGIWLNVNPAWTRVLGWEVDEIVGRTFDWLHHPDDLDPTRREIARLEAGETTLAFESRLLTQEGGYRRLAWTAIAVEDRIYAAARDITEQRALEDRLHQAQKMEAVGQLTGGIAHDFNNMLAVVIGSLDLLERRLARGNTDIGRYVAAAMDGATRAAALTQRLLAFSRRQPLDPEPVDANRLIAGMADLLRRTLGEPVGIETILADGLWRATADPSQLENAILNLAVNARDAMPGGGSLTIETGNALVDDDYAREYEIAPGQYVLIAVTDTGIGMTPEVLAKAVDPFFTTKPIGKGTGLGLSQVFGFARQSGGHIKIFSTPDIGTTVMFYLPRAADEPDPGTAARPREAAPRGASTEIVMVVEDEERVRTYSVEALRELGYTVIPAADGREALAAIAAGQDVTLLFTDMVMPEMSGRELAEQASALLPDLKVLFTTGYAREAIWREGTAESGLAVLPKPFDIEQLGARIRGVLDT